MTIVHLTSSTFFGGPERQMLGLAHALAPAAKTLFLSFSEGGRCRAFLDRVRSDGFEAEPLGHDTPHFRAAVREIRGRLERAGADVLCCHGYKAILLGRLAARRAGVPVIAVSRGWTRETRKVRIYEALERLTLRWMDCVVCVSEGQAAKVRRAGVPRERVVVIRNAIHAGRFDSDGPDAARTVKDLFPSPPRRVVGAAGRLSPEKGFQVLVEAAAEVCRADDSVGFVVFGEGALRDELTREIASRGLDGRFHLAGFRHDLDRVLPGLDLMVLPSFTEGLPNVVLEAFAAGVPVVATAVGGTPEVVVDGESGYLVPPGDPARLAGRIRDALASEERRVALGARGRERIVREFTFEAQADQYRALFQELRAGRRGARDARPARVAWPSGPVGGEARAV